MAQTEKRLLQCGRPGLNPWIRKIPWRRKWQPTPLLLPGKFHGRRSLVGYSPWGRKELDTTEQLHLNVFLLPYLLRKYLVCCIKGIILEFFPLYCVVYKAFDQLLLCLCILWLSPYELISNVLHFAVSFFFQFQLMYLFCLEKVEVAQSCPTLCDPADYTVHGILQARILEWVAFPFSRWSSQLRSPALQADSLPVEPQGKPKNSGVGSLIPSPADLPDPGIEPRSPALQADSLPTELSGKSYFLFCLDCYIKIH